jgi:drug/metabolite transporter (DMT)-like permease
MLSRRAHVLAVSGISQGAGLALLLVATIFAWPLERHSFELGLLTGIGGALGLAFFYAALAAGTMSIVAPIVGASAVIPFGLAVAGGERPSRLAVAGAALAIAGVVLASLDERRADAGARGRAIGLALVASVAIGLFLYFLGRGSKDGDVLSTLVGARVVSLPLQLAGAALLRAPVRLPAAVLWPVLAVGLGDVVANGLFGFASHHGLLAIVSVLGSVYPIATVFLAHVILGERITRMQWAGVLAAVAGVALVTAA